MPSQQSVPISLMGTDSSNTSFKISSGCCCHGRREVVPLFDCSRWEALLDKVLVSDGRT